jgi:hypothetical protein
MAGLKGKSGPNAFKHNLAGMAQRQVDGATSKRSGRNPNLI